MGKGLRQATLPYDEIARAIRTRHIATALDRGSTSFSPSFSQADAYAELARRDFDFAPVLAARRVVGRVARKELRRDADGALELVMQPLSDTMLVSADAPLHDLMPALAHDPFLFVVDKTRIAGLVTPSDFNKESARAYMFLLLADLEIRIAAAIRACPTPQEDFVARLRPRDREIVSGKYSSQRRRGVVADYVACMSLSLLIQVGALEPKVFQTFGCTTGNQFRSDLAPINDLRNAISHSAGDLVTNRHGLGRLIRMEGRLRRLLSSRA